MAIRMSPAVARSTLAGHRIPKAQLVAFTKDLRRRLVSVHRPSPPIALGGIVRRPLRFSPALGKRLGGENDGHGAGPLVGLSSVVRHRPDRGSANDAVQDRTVEPLPDPAHAAGAHATHWQNRPLDPVYPVVFFDALRVKIRDEGLVKNKAVYVALALNPDGEKDVLGLWIEQTEGAKFWLKVVNELKARGVNDILIAVVDGLKGFPDAITSVFPQTVVQTCIVHLIRNSLAFVSWKDRRAILPAIKAIYRAENADMAWSGSRSSRPNGASAIRRSARPGAGPGSTWCRSSRSHPASAR
jgi:Transposase, Mutator family